MKKRRGIGVLPSLLTLGNLLCGFASIAYAGNHQFGEAAWLILVGMIFDAFDGRVARLANLTSRFGAELDSLADMVTFGIAPAILVKDVAGPFLNMRILWPLCALYAACAALRLARFNVETSPEPGAHLRFSGLPSPAAAGVVATLVMLHAHLEPGTDLFEITVPAGMFARVLPYTLAFLSAALGALMVSRISYPHLVARFLSGRRPFAYFAGFLFAGILVAIEHEISLAAGFAIYMLSGPLVYVVHRLRVPHDTPLSHERSPQ